MNLFIGLAALMTLLIVIWMVWPLLSAKKAEGVSAQRLNAAIHRDQLLALQADLNRGLISPQDFETTRDELQLRLLDDTESYESAPAEKTSVFWTAKRTAGAVCVSLPLLALGIYLQLGTPAAIDQIANAPMNEHQVQQMVDTLAAKLKSNPNDPKGWAMLARSYKVLGRLEESRQAYENTGKLIESEPDLLVDYADVLAALAGNRLNGKPEELINQALRINPEHPMGLMISGVALYQRQDYSGAIARWEKLLSLVEPNSMDAQQIQGNIAQAQAKGGVSTSSNSKLAPVPAEAAGVMTPDKINQMVERLANRLKDNPDDFAGWARLANAYKVQGRVEEAIAAYEKTGKLMDTDAEMMLHYADLLATRSRSLQGKPSELINKALALTPKHPMALMMAGQAAYQSGNYKAAIGHWQTALTVLPANSTDIEPIKAEIADATRKLNGTGKP